MLNQPNTTEEAIEIQLISAKKASRELAKWSDDKKNKLLIELANALTQNYAQLLIENKKDLDNLNILDPKYDRLKLTKDRVMSMVNDIINVSKLKSPVGTVLEDKLLSNGLQLKKITVPLGVIGIIYEARPNVTVDVFTLCLKTGNACVLKGGSEANYSNQYIVYLIKKIIDNSRFNTNIIQLLPPTRDAANYLLNATDYIDVIIPRGSQNLINFVRDNAKVPVIETGAGIVHIYFDEYGSLEKGINIINNAKTRRVSVCNALDCLIIHKKALQHLPELITKLISQNVIIYADSYSFKILKGQIPDHLLQEAKQKHYGTEFLDYKLAIKTVENITQALDHIAKYGSKHSETILSENLQNIDIFCNDVDAAVVYANTSTAFTDGGQFGLGAEIGISTQKLHARGPMALKEICSYKWIVKSNGLIRD